MPWMRLVPQIFPKRDRPSTIVGALAGGDPTTRLAVSNGTIMHPSPRVSLKNASIRAGFLAHHRYQNAFNSMPSAFRSLRAPSLCDLCKTARQWRAKSVPDPGPLPRPRSERMLAGLPRGKMVDFQRFKKTWRRLADCLLLVFRGAFTGEVNEGPDGRLSIPAHFVIGGRLYRGATPGPSRQPENPKLQTLGLETQTLKGTRPVGKTPKP